MAASLALDIAASLSWVFQDTQELTTISDTAKLQFAADLANGTADDQADRLWHDERTLATATHEDLDLTALAASVFENSVTVSLATVRALLLINTATTAGEDLLVGGAGAGGNAWASPFNGDQDAQLVLPADATLLLVNKKNTWTIANGASDQLRIANDGTGSITYRVVIVGTSA
ncbi:MAG: hypothetical protein DWQ35_07390 [Planctomycetota bacterium]|nr:MAG: hypothetical protein DWQ35_07390 [Planctomycetota bacterium]REK42476.1 MAG: hypothetical protein DWQ46_13380 [Planctomycetota bacterium]